MSPYRLPHVRDWYLHGCNSPWHPLPPRDEELQQLWIHYPNMTYPILDLVAVRDTFFTLVHPGNEEVVDGRLHECVNLAILPDWLLNNEAALQVLDLK